MNKKGFTLIELLSSITLMTIIATIASINLIKILDEKEKISTKNTESIITTAAYIELDKNADLKEECLTNGCTITTDILIKEGLLNSEDVNKTEVINISKENNTKICKIK